MARFKYDGREFDAIDDPTFAQVEWVERQARTNWPDLTASQRTRAVFLLSLRDAGVMLTWADMAEAKPSEFTWVAPDPTPTPKQPADRLTSGAGPSKRATSGGSSRRKSSVSAPGSGTD